MSYTPPDKSTINFAITSGYTPPAINELDFTPGSGDTILSPPAFTSVESFGTTSIYVVVLLTPLQSTESMSDVSIYAGEWVQVEPFISTNSITSDVVIAIECNPFISIEEFVSSITQILELTPLQSTESMSNISIYAGEWVQVEPFISTNSMESNILLLVSTNPLVSISSFGTTSIAEFVITTPFQSTELIEVSDIKMLNLSDALVFYFFLYEGIEIPISSFQCRMRNDAQTFLEVVIPGIEYIDTISASPSGNMSIEIGYKIDANNWVRKEIVSATMETISSYNGSISNSIVLDGRKIYTYTPKDIILKNTTYRNNNNGKLSYRFAEPNMELLPGANVSVDGRTFVADVITYFISSDSKYMEVTGT